MRKFKIKAEAEEKEGKKQEGKNVPLLFILNLLGLNLSSNAAAFFFFFFFFRCLPSTVHGNKVLPLRADWIFLKSSFPSLFLLR